MSMGDVKKIIKKSDGKNAVFLLFWHVLSGTNIFLVSVFSLDRKF